MLKRQRDEIASRNLLDCSISLLGLEVSLHIKAHPMCNNTLPPSPGLQRMRQTTEFQSVVWPWILVGQWAYWPRPNRCAILVCLTACSTYIPLHWAPSRLQPNKNDLRIARKTNNNGLKQGSWHMFATLTGDASSFYRCLGYTSVIFGSGALLGEGKPLIFLTVWWPWIITSNSNEFLGRMIAINQLISCP